MRRTAVGRGRERRCQRQRRPRRRRGRHQAGRAQVVGGRGERPEGRVDRNEDGLRLWVVDGQRRPGRGGGGGTGEGGCCRSGRGRRGRRGRGLADGRRVDRVPPLGRLVVRLAATAMLIVAGAVLARLGSHWRGPKLGGAGRINDAAAGQRTKATPVRIGARPCVYARRPSRSSAEVEGEARLEGDNDAEGSCGKPSQARSSSGQDIRPRSGWSRNAVRGNGPGAESIERR